MTFESKVDTVMKLREVKAKCFRSQMGPYSGNGHCLCDLSMVSYCSLTTLNDTKVIRHVQTTPLTDPGQANSASYPQWDGKRLPATLQCAQWLGVRSLRL